LTDRAAVASLLRSPTGATWIAHLSRSLGVVVVLPLALARLGAGDAVIWLLFETLLGLMILADFGVAPTFIRAVAYGAGGAPPTSLAGGPGMVPGIGRPNWETLSAVVSTMKRAYLHLALLSMVLLATLGTAAVWGPVAASSDSGHAWLAWIAVVIVSPLSLWSESQGSFLQGMSLVPLYRRSQAVIWIGSAVSSVGVLSVGGGLLGLTLATQAWLVIWVGVKARMCKNVLGGRYSHFAARADPTVVAAVWPSAWRSGLGIWFGQGAVHVSAILYAQVATTSAAGAYLLSLRLLQFLSGFSRAPFYSRLPELATLLAKGERRELLALAQRGMAWSHRTYALGFVSTGVLLAPILDLIGSQVSAPPSALWGGLGLAFLAERYGAMHIQLYSLTNRIVWHIANGVSGSVFIVASMTLLGSLGVYAFPVSLLLANIGFYAWYSARQSHREFELTVRRFDIPAGGMAVGLAIAYVVVTLITTGPAMP
jgi:hypothetical protein